MQKNKYSNNNKSGVSGACGGKGASAKMRRSITIMDRLHLDILKLRGELMMMGIDMDYTAMLNLCLEFGIQKMKTKDITQEEARMVADYALDTKLKEEGVYDVLRDNLINTLTQSPKRLGN
jgi:uncharacterized metal-binding protein